MNEFLYYLTGFVGIAFFLLLFGCAKKPDIFSDDFAITVGWVLFMFCMVGFMCGTTELVKWIVRLFK